MNREAYRQQLGCRLRALRTARNITKRQVADTLGCTVQNIDGIERGDWGTDASNYPALAALLGVGVAEILGEEPEHAA